MKENYNYKPVLFFALTYVVTWIPWSIAAYAASHQGLAAYAGALNLIGLVGPIAVTLFLVLTSGSAALKRDFKDRVVNLRRVRPLYAVVIVVLPIMVMCVSIRLSLLIDQPADQFQLSGGAHPLGMIILAMVLAPIMEEMGWHGYGVDSLRAETGMMKATLLFGVLWSVWHAPLFLISGTYQNDLAKMDNPVFVANFFISIIPAAIIANWIYYKNNRSIAAAVLFHAMLNAAAVLFNAGQVTKCIATLVYAIIAVGIIAIDRGLFTEGSRNFLSSDAAPTQ